MSRSGLALHAKLHLRGRSRHHRLIALNLLVEQLDICSLRKGNLSSHEGGSGIFVFLSIAIVLTNLLPWRLRLCLFCAQRGWPAALCRISMMSMMLMHLLLSISFELLAGWGHLLHLSWLIGLLGRVRTHYYVELGVIVGCKDTEGRHLLYLLLFHLRFYCIIIANVSAALAICLFITRQFYNDYLSKNEYQLHLKQITLNWFLISCLCGNIDELFAFIYADVTVNSTHFIIQIF